MALGLNKYSVLLALALVSVILVSGCILGGDSQTDEGATGEEEAEPEPIEMNEPPEVNCSEQYELYEECIKTLPEETCENLIDMECVQVVGQEKVEGNLKAVTNYLDSHLIEIFGEQSSRILSIEYEVENKTTLTYRVSKVDPGMESYYFAGVLLIVFPEIENTRIEGLNTEGKVIETSIKFPSRDNYIFSELYFPDYAQESECESDEDCYDNNDCTIDKCVNNRCSNAYVIKSGCSGP